MAAARVTPRTGLPSWDRCEGPIFCLSDMQEAKRQVNSQVGQSLDGRLGTCLQDLRPLSIEKNTEPDTNCTRAGNIAQPSLLQHWNSKTASWLVLRVTQ